MKEFVKPFLTPKKPTVTYNTSNTLQWGTVQGGGTFMLGNTDYDPSSFKGFSTIVTLNEKMLNDSSPLLIAAAVVHETIHSYIYFNISLAKFNVDQSVGDNDANWMASLNEFYQMRQLPSNYSNHKEMLTDYFDKAVAVLQSWNSLQTTKYTTTELAMAMMYGLDNAGSTASQQLKNDLKDVFEKEKKRYGVTGTDLDKFNKTNLNSKTTLPKSGC